MICIYPLVGIGPVSLEKRIFKISKPILTLLNNNLPFEEELQCSYLFEHTRKTISQPCLVDIGTMIREDIFKTLDSFFTLS